MSETMLQADTDPSEVDAEGLSRQQIKWIPLVVPGAALTMALCALAVLSMA